MRGKDPWTSPDPLGEALHFLRMSGTFYCRSELTDRWGMALPPMPRSSTTRRTTTSAIAVPYYATAMREMRRR